MGNRVSDEELERALAELAQRESEVDEGEVDEQSQANLRRWVGGRMQSPVSADEEGPTPVEEVCDEQGVDRSQIRAFLELTPRQRIDRASRSAAFFLRVRRLNDRTAIR